jgi:hypothetical protein
MNRTTDVECGEGATAWGAAVTPAVDDVTRAMRRLRSEQLDEISRVVDTGSYFAAGHRTPTDWLTATTHESIGQCKVTLALAAGIQRMPIIKAAFGRGELAESALRLLTAAWHADIAEVFARDEELLLSWATQLPHRDFSMVLETWRLHADPEHHARTATERYDDRSLSLSSMLDGMGKLDGVLDPEGFAIVREAIRALSQPAEDDDRTPRQRRCDGLVTMAKMALEHLEPVVGTKRRRPRVVATIDYHDLVDASGGGTIDTNHDRIVVPAEAIRRMACDANIHRYVADPLGTVIDHGRGRRTVSDAQFDRLVIRDHGCRVAGCGIPASGCEAHHARHWLDDGATIDDNMVLLCWHHHHWLHEQHWRIEPLGAGYFTLRDSHGAERPLRPPLVGTRLPSAAPALACV